MNQTAWLTQHASPHWISSKTFLEGIPDDNRQHVLEELAFAFPTWFYELLVEFNDSPLILEPFQINYLLDNSTFKITNKTRQAGGSMQLALATFFKAYTRKRFRADIVSINLREATDKIKYVRMFWETLPLRYRLPLAIDNALNIGFHTGKSNLSEIKSLASSTGVRGGKKHIIFDEFAHIPGIEDIFKAALPAIMNGTDLGVDLVSTPNGKYNLFGEIWLNEPNEYGNRMYDAFSRHKFIWCDVGRFVTNYAEAQKAWHEEYNQDMVHMQEMVNRFGNDKIQLICGMYPWEYFLQEYCGHFIDDSHALFSFDLIKSCLHYPSFRVDTNDETAEQVEPLDAWMVKEDNKIYPNRDPENDNYAMMGVDFGKSEANTDKTSIQVLEKDNGILKHRFCQNLNRTDFGDIPSQAEKIAEIARALRVNKIICDEGNLGIAMVPLLRRLLPSMNIEGIDFNQKNKQEMVIGMKAAMEQKKIWILSEEKQLQAEIHGMQGDRTPNGNYRYHGEPHDDMFWAFALAVKEGTYSHFAIYTIDSLLKGINV